MNRIMRWRRRVLPLALVLAIWAALGHGPALNPAAAQQPNPPAAGNPPAADGAAANDESLLEWIVRTSGWIGAILLVLSIYFVAKVVSLFLELRPETAAPPAIVEQAEELLKARDYMGIYKLVKEDDSFFSNIVRSGLTELPQGLAEARDAMDRTGETLVVHMEKNISMLAVIGSLGPMIGLLGTLLGMIASFGAIARSGAQVDTGGVADGISQALVLTFEGVGLAVPAIYFFAVFRNRVSSISAATMLSGDEFIRRVHALSRAKPKPAAPAPPSI